MKFILSLLVFSFYVHAASEAKNKILPIIKEEETVKKEQKKNAKLDEIIKEEDCEEKAKKPIEIKPESLSLTGNTGCSLEDAH